MNKKKIYALSINIILTIITCIYAVKSGANPSMVTIMGSFVSIFIGLLIALVFKVPNYMFYLMNIFIYFASPVGSVVNLYRRVNSYDKVIHFISGMIILSFGYMLFWKLINYFKVSKKEHKKLLFISILFGICFSVAAAGVWEILEYLMDIITSGSMQRGVIDTITDMIAGTLGAFTYSFFLYYHGAKKLKLDE